MPLPCDLAIGFIIHTDLSEWCRLNSSTKITYSSGRRYVTGKKLYLRLFELLLLALFEATFSLERLLALLQVADKQILATHFKVVAEVVDLLMG